MTPNNNGGSVINPHKCCVYLLMKEGIFSYMSALLKEDNRLEAIVEDILDRRTDPYSASEDLIAQTLRPGGSGT